MKIPHKLFFNFETGIHINRNKSQLSLRDAIQYLVHTNGSEPKFYVSGIEELGPRPASFPNNSPIDRIDGEIKLIFLLLNLIGESDIIFCKKEKLKQLYYRSKKFGIRESYIPIKIRLMKVKKVKISADSFNSEITKTLKRLKDLKKRPGTHWNILHQLFLHTSLNSLLITNNGFRYKKGIFELLITRSKKKDLREFLYGM